MAGIGEYVHYRLKNYRAYGIGINTVEGMSLTQSYKQAHSELLANINRTKTALNLVTLENEMNQTFDLLSKSPQPEDFYSKDSFEQKFKDLVEKKIEEKNNGHWIDWTNLSVNSLGSQFSQAKMKYGQKNTSNDYFQLKTWDKFKQLVAQSKNVLTGALAKGAISQSEANALAKQFQQIDANIAQQETAIAQNGIKKQTKNLESLFKRYNDIVSQYELPSKKEFGDLGEFVAEFCLLKAAGFSNKTVSRLIKSHIQNPIGMQKSTTTLTFSDFLKEDDLREQLGGTYSIEEAQGGRIIATTLSGSQNTIDIQTRFEDKIIANNSVKNKDSVYAPIKILGGAPFTSLFNLVNTDFVNHYMNLLAFSKNYSNWISQRANPLWEKAIMVRGLSGQRTKGNSGLANIFIVFDRKAQKFRLFSIQDILFRSLWGEGSPKGLELTGDPLPTSVDNTYVGYKSRSLYSDASKRIAKIIGNLHNIKINASLRLSSLSLV